MNILIKGMEMPINCHSCPMCLMRFCQAGDRELSERETRPNAKRPEDCPLLSVPPHGGLIDADALNYTMLYKENWMRGTGVEALAVWRKDIDSAPTVIPASKEGE